MPELLLELLTEEIPARMQTRAAEDLLRLARDRLTVAGLTFVQAQSFVTPRRLVLVVTNVPAATVDIAEEKRGPRVGAPQNAIDGFLKSAGVTLADCEPRDTDKGIFYFAVVRRAGRATATVLPDVLRAVLIDLPWPKSMRFPAAPFRWVRPLTSVLCRFDGATLALDLGAVPVGGETRGHRFLAPAMFPVNDFADYQRQLRAAHVVLDAAERRQTIADALDRVASAAGLTVKDDLGLLDEVTGLVEWPVVLMGAIDREFMDLPPEVLTTSMRTHQKYFAAVDGSGRLAPKFLLVANNIADDGGREIVAGNERVLRARLSDARFFWDQDRKIRLADRMPKLAERVFYQGLGTMADKAERMSRLAGEIADRLGQGAAREEASRAGELAKADLASAMVGEFPELQGIMGRYYAAADGESAAVAQAIGEHYSPLGPHDRCPTAPVSIAVAIADKLDTLIGFFGIGEKPTGSRDPFALRRAALGIVRLLLENGARLRLGDAFRHAYENYNGALTVPVEQVAAELLDFFADRLKVHLRDQGVRHDLITAVFARGEDDLVRLTRRVAALDAFLKTEDGTNLLTAYRRAANIVGIEEKREGVKYLGTPDTERFVATEEIMLANRLDEAGSRTKTALGAEDFAGAMSALASLRTQIDDFFTKITVNDKDPALRDNRLRLLARIRDTFDLVADFSRIEG